MLRLSPALRALTLPSWRSPANLRLLIGIRLEKLRASVLKRVPLSTALAVVKRIPDCPVPGRSRATQPLPAGAIAGFPRRLSVQRGPCVPPCARQPVRKQFRSDTCSPFRVSIASREIVTDNKTTRGSLLRNLSDRSRQMNPDGRRRPRIGIPRRVTLSSFARPTIENEPARRLRLEAGFTSAVYDTSYQGPPPICQTR
jgi:hypothetical protein